MENANLPLLYCLTNRKQKTKIGSFFSSWCDINTGLPLFIFS